ncbi:hypothetical protein SNEBB_006744 [Seison nebaliae]|nr:hypothetical protein SNEBB_006744 [Seison nebaliae]
MFLGVITSIECGLPRNYNWQLNNGGSNGGPCDMRTNRNCQFSQYQPQIQFPQPSSIQFPQASSIQFPQASSIQFPQPVQYPQPTYNNNNNNNGGGCSSSNCVGGRCANFQGQSTCQCTNNCPIPNPCIDTLATNRYNYPYPGDGTKYIQCDGIPGSYWIRSCGYDRVFDPRIGSCNYKPGGGYVYGK